MFFVKMHGAGNDYIFVPCHEIKVDDMKDLAVRMSDRHFGVGGDGVVYLFPSLAADVKMRMFNSDGSEGDMCGNAVRCIAKLLSEKFDKDVFTVETNAGIKSVKKSGDEFTVNMGKPKISLGELNLDERIEYVFVSMGNPHCVIFADNIDASEDMAKAIQSKFDGGINVEFVWGGGEKIKVRVFERGSGETLSCGTGACASVAACVKMKRSEQGKDIQVFLKGGILKVNYNDDIFLTGDAEKIYEGEYYDKVHFCDGRSR